MKIRDYIKNFTNKELAEGYAFVYGSVEDIRNGTADMKEAENKIAAIRRMAENDDSGIWEWYLERETEESYEDNAYFSDESRTALRKQKAKYAAALLVQFHKISAGALPWLNAEEKIDEEISRKQASLLPAIIY